jgi:hypothetical protein
MPSIPHDDKILKMFNSIKEFIFPTIEPDPLPEEPQVASLSGFFKDLLGIEQDMPQEPSTEEPELLQDTMSDKQLIFSNDFLPTLTIKSCIITFDMAAEIRSHLPPLLKEAPVWELFYSTQVHGISLSTLYNNSAEAGPCLIVLKDDDDGIFGGFVNQSIHVDTGFYGDDTSFLFKVLPDHTIKVWKATGENSYITYSDHNCIAFGGGAGKFGLWIDQELYNGHSESCSAFGNDKLSKQSEFKIDTLELFRFKI